MKANIATRERTFRVIVGLIAAFGSVQLMKSAETLAWQAFAVAFLVLGLDLLATGIIGFCPLYHLLGRDLKGRHKE